MADEDFDPTVLEEPVVDADEAAAELAAAEAELAAAEPVEESTEEPEPVVEPEPEVVAEEPAPEPEPEAEAEEPEYVPEDIELPTPAEVAEELLQHRCAECDCEDGVCTKLLAPVDDPAWDLADVPLQSRVAGVDPLADVPLQSRINPDGSAIV